MIQTRCMNLYYVNKIRVFSSKFILHVQIRFLYKMPFAYWNKQYILLTLTYNVKDRSNDANSSQDGARGKTEDSLTLPGFSSAQTIVYKRKGFKKGKCFFSPYVSYAFALFCSMLNKYVTTILITLHISLYLFRGFSWV